MRLNQYYTKNAYGDFLVNSISMSSPKVALDLGFGEGHLLHAAKRRWEDLNLIGIDIDRENIIRANSCRFINALELNGFEIALPTIVNERFGDIDLLISNPPYFSTDLNANNKRILQAIGLLDCLSKRQRKIPAELIFLAQNLRLLTKSGEIGIILPAGLVSGQKWKPVREFLLSNYHVSNVIQLPIDSFKNTDAQTFILTIRHKLAPTNRVNLSHIDEPETLQVDYLNAMERADHSFYCRNSRLANDNYISTEDYTIFRGNKSHNYLKSKGENHVHTIDMPNIPGKIELPLVTEGFKKVAVKGDILVSRVGRRCLGRVSFVSKGSTKISDCIIVVRPLNSNVGQKIWNKLSSKKCRDYFDRASLGVGAKYITYQTIRDYLTNKHAITK